MDGVIVDTEPVHAAYFKQFEELNIAKLLRKCTLIYRFSIAKHLQKLKELFTIDHEVEDLIEAENYFNDAFDSKADLELLEGVENLIKELHQNGMQLILASSASKVTIERVLIGLSYTTIFKISGEDFPQSKPHPAILNMQQAFIGQKRKLYRDEDSTMVLKLQSSRNFVWVIQHVHSEAQDLSKQM
jgi:beta-phosphoglucomutase-like phosphatase (HAD superfamily)